MSNTLMNDRVAFIGVGQAGGNIAVEFKNLGYTTFFINTSIEDLNTIKVDTRYKYHIPTAQGCNKDRDKAKQYTKDYYEIISSQIATKFGNITKLFFCFSMGGGTGSGISPLLINALSKKMQNVTFNAICIIPSDSESARIKFNAFNCYTELKAIPYLSNVYFIDNNSVINNDINIFPTAVNNLEFLNKQIAYRINDILSMCNPDTRGIIDTEEIEELLKVNGNVLLADIRNEDVVVDNIFPSTKKGCQFLAYSLTNDKDYLQDKVEELFGKPLDIYKGYNNNNSFVAIFGLPFPDKRIEDLVKSYENDIEKIDTIEDEEINIEISKLPDLTKRRKVRLEKAKQMNALLDEL